MNLIRTPATSDAEALRDEYPHIETNTRGASSSQAEKKKAGPAKGAGKGKKGSAGMFMENKKTAPKPSKSATTNSNKESAASAAAEKKKEAAEKEKENKKQKPPQRNRSPVGSEEEDSDDGGLLIEYPDPVDTGPVAVAPVRSRESSFPPTIRKFTDFVSNQAEESEDDADAEYEEEDYMIEEGGDSSGEGFKLPSPVGRNTSNAQGGGAIGGEEMDDDTPEDDELMAMLEEEMGEGGGMDVDSESSVSEED